MANATHKELLQLQAELNQQENLALELSFLGLIGGLNRDSKKR